jgi:hypothetical protein
MVKFTSGTRFKCNQSGNIFEFTSEHDIKTMRTHPGYTEVIQEEPKKPVGRPPKSNLQTPQEE